MVRTRTLRMLRYRVLWHLRLGWLRYRLGFCRMGTNGCWRRPAGYWTVMGTTRIPLCEQHWNEIRHPQGFGEEVIPDSEWVSR